MSEKFVTTSSGRGGARPGAGRKKGSKTSNNTEVFYAKCTKEEKQKLSEYLKKLRGLIVIFGILFFFANTCFSKQVTWQIENPTLPKDIHIEITPTKNSFVFTRKRNCETQYSILMKDLVLVDEDNNTYKLIEPYAYKHIYMGTEIPWQPIYKELFTFSVVPLENIRVSNYINRYNEAVKTSVMGAYTGAVNIDDKNSVIKDKNFIIKVPVFNTDTFKTDVYIFKFKRIYSMN